MGLIIYSKWWLELSNEYSIWMCLKSLFDVVMAMSTERVLKYLRDSVEHRSVTRYLRQ